MAIEDRNRVYDGFEGLAGGMNCSEDPADINDISAHKLINATARGGRISTRPSWMDRHLIFENKHSEEVFRDGKFQGSEPYTFGGSFIVSASMGHIFLTNIITGQVRNITPIVGLNSEYIDTMYFLNAGRYFIIQDTVNQAVIIDNGAPRRADPAAISPYVNLIDEFTGQPIARGAGEIPVGSFMAYGHNRIIVAIPGTNEFLVSDIALPNDPANILRFTENAYLKGGGSFQLPPSFGPLTALGFQLDNNTSLSYGPLIASGLTGMSWFDITERRERWTQLDISRTLSISHGAASHSSFLNYNDDIIFQGTNEIRTLRQTSADVERRVHRGFSREVDCFLSDNTPELLNKSVGMIHDRRALMSVAAEFVPVRDSKGEEILDVRHKGLIALDFDRYGGLSDTNAPAYDGLWTGVKPVGMASFPALNRGFVFSRDDDGQVRLYEQKPDSYFDNRSQPITMRIFPGTFRFKVTVAGDRTVDSGFSLKDLQYADIWISDVIGDVELKLFYKSDQYPQWTQWGNTVKINSPAIVSNADPVDELPNYKRFSYPRIRFTSTSPADCNKINNTQLRMGYEFDTYIEITGRCTVRRFRTHAKAVSSEEANAGGSCEPIELNGFDGPFQDDYDYCIKAA